MSAFTNFQKITDRIYYPFIYSLVVISIVIGIFLRFQHLTLGSLWLDELHTMNEANPQKSMKEVIDQVKAFEAIPPFYFLSIHIWFKLFDFNDFYARLFSAVAGCMGIGVIYLCGLKMYNRRVALFAAALTALNYFHISYSQDARPYALLFFLSALSCYFFVRVLQNINFKNSLFYDFSGLLLIYTHYFGVLLLIAQYLLIFSFVLFDRKERKNLLIHFGLAALLIVLGYLPWMPAMFNSLGNASFWAPVPKFLYFTDYFEEYFGDEDPLVKIFFCLIFLYFILAIRSKAPGWKINLLRENTLFLSFVILFTWMFISYLLPYLKSVWDVPILVTRYTIVTLPAILLAIAIGIEMLKYKYLQLLAFLAIFVLACNFYWKKRANPPTLLNSHFREVSKFLVKNNPGNFPIISNKKWYYNYYFEQWKYKTNYAKLDFERLKDQDSSGKAFWLLQAHDATPIVDDSIRHLIEASYIPAEVVDYLDNTWAKLYVRPDDYASYLHKKHFSLRDISKNKASAIGFGLDSLVRKKGQIHLYGWAYLNNSLPEDQQLKLLLCDSDSAYVFASAPIIRLDLNRKIKIGHDLTFSGFMTSFPVYGFKAGTYQLALLIENGTEKKKAFTYLGKKINFEPKDFFEPKKITSIPIKYWLDSFTDRSDQVEIKGWAFIKNQDSQNNEIHIVLKSNKNEYTFPAEMHPREDLSAYFKTGFNLSNSGFQISIPKKEIAKGKYQVGLKIKHTTDSKEALLMTDQSITK